jgi:hypothetical protein
MIIEIYLDNPGFIAKMEILFFIRFIIYKNHTTCIKRKLIEKKMDKIEYKIKKIQSKYFFKNKMFEEKYDEDLWFDCKIFDYYIDDIIEDGYPVGFRNWFSEFKII